MNLQSLGELALIDKIRNRFDCPAPDVLAGVGDDAAVLKQARGRLLATTDMMVEGVHFDINLITPHQLGFKLVSVNVSDIFAMGGKPRHLLLALAMPGTTTLKYLNGFLDGVALASNHYGVSVVGGDVTGASQAVFSATVLGHADKPLMRSGARPGDNIYVTGALGDSACGLELLRRIGKPVSLDKPMHRPLKWDIMEPLLRRHLMPVARKPGAWAGYATAAIDISDGLLLDLDRLCTASGVGAHIDVSRMPLSAQLCAVVDKLGLDAMALAMGGGEDYEILFTAPPGRRPRAVRIGRVVKKEGLKIVYPDGAKKAVAPKGYTHFG